MKTQVELLKECCDIKDAACVKYQKRIAELEKENKKLKEDNRFLTKISKEYMKKENIIEVAEFTELYKDDLKEKNKELKAEIERRKEVVKELNNYNKLRIAENNELKKLLTIKNK